jgi:DNA processing protein
MDKIERIKTWIQLLSTPNFGNVAAIKLTGILGEPSGFIGDKDALTDIEFISEAAKKYLSKPDEPTDWNRIVKLINKYEIKFLTVLDDEYPTLLRNIFDPPAFLFFRGNLKKEDFRRTLAIVGTRRASNYGKMMTSEITSQLIQAGFTIVSGLAYGIDALSHIAALNNGGRTIAVMGTGVDQFYPPENRELAEDIIQNGIIVSELGAKIVTSAKDILEEYDLILDEQTRIFPELNAKEEDIYQILIENKPEIHFDTLIMKTGFSVGELSTILLSLELKNVIKKVPGNKIVPMY